MSEFQWYAVSYGAVPAHRGSPVVEYTFKHLIDTWDHFVDAIKVKFKNQSYNHDNLQKFYDYKQIEQQTSMKYLEEKVKLSSELRERPSMQGLLEACYAGLTQKYKNNISVQSLQDPFQLIQACQALEVQRGWDFSEREKSTCSAEEQPKIQSKSNRNTVKYGNPSFQCS